MIVGFVRHGRTAWNDAGRMQGRADIPLSEAGRIQVHGWRLPASLASARVVTSPLVRAVETAILLGSRDPIPDAGLIEMDWGEWEGETLAALRARHGEAFTRNADRGLDFRPPRGESPREMQSRVNAWLAGIAAHAEPVVAVTHKGVIRAALTLVTGWNMLGKPPVRLADDAVHLIEVDAGGAVRVHEWNVPLVIGPVSPRRAAPRPAP